MMRRRDDCGSVTAFVVIITLSLLVCAGLVFDGGRILAARRQAGGIAMAAARRGAQELDVEGTVVIVDDAKARTEAEAFVDRAAVAQNNVITFRQASTVPDAVTVEVRISQPTFLLGLVGIHSSVVKATRTARPVPGP